jgi:hypothetical protein
MPGLLDDYLTQLMNANNGSTGFLDPAMAQQAQASMLGQGQGILPQQGGPGPARKRFDWSGDNNIWQTLTALGAGIAGGSGQGWGAGIGSGMGLALEQQRLRQNDDFKKLALALQMQEAQGTQAYRDAQLGNQAERTRLYGESVRKPRPRSFAVNPNTGAYYDTTTAQEVGGDSAPRNPYFSGKMNEGQGKAATYVDRMAKSHKIITELEAINSSDNPLSTAATAMLPQQYANVAQSKDRQKVVQAQRDFINSVLRRESGAVIAETEFENARLQYFPQIGDSPEVIKQKRQNRLAAMQGIAREAGPNYEPPAFDNPQETTDGVLDYNEYFGR